MEKIGDILNSTSKDFLPVQRDLTDERKKLAYRIAVYFNEPAYQWFRHFKDSGVYTSFIKVYFEEAIMANKPKKTQAKFLMKKLFPNGKHLL